MPFRESLVWARFHAFQRTQCAYCGEDLVYDNRDKEGARGAWHAHHIDGNPRNNSFENCACLCVNDPDNCHLKVGHGGDLENGHLVSPTDLPYLGRDIMPSAPASEP